MGLGLAIIVGTPPNWWPKMPSQLVVVAVILGAIILVVGLGMAISGSFPTLPAHRAWPLVPGVTGCILIAVSISWVKIQSLQPPPAPPTSQTSPGSERTLPTETTNKSSLPNVNGQISLECAPSRRPANLNPDRPVRLLELTKSEDWKHPLTLINVRELVLGTDLIEWPADYPRRLSNAHS